MQNHNIPLSDIETQFLNFMRTCNCAPAGSFTLRMDSKIHRYMVEGDKRGERTGAYCVFTDGWPAGWVQNWRNGDAVSWSFNRDSLNDDLKRAITDKEYQAMLEKSKTHQEQLRKEHEKLKADASERARMLVEQLPELKKDDSHPYLTKKQIYPYGLKIQRDNNNALVVPLQNIDGEIVSLQWIFPDGGKKFFTYAPVDSAFFPIALEDSNLEYEGRRNPILIGEGVATMSTVYELTGMPCVAAMNCGNIKKVAEALKNKYPDNPIIIMADNDHKKKVNAGKDAAEAACRDLKLDGVVYPDFADNEDGTDWNDFYKLHDCDDDFCLKAIRAKLNQLPLYNKRAKYKAMAEQFGFMDAEFIDTFCQPLPGENFLIEDWIPTESMMMMFAPSGSGKGFVAIDLAYAIATHDINSWHGKKVLKHGPVVYLAGEGQKGMRKRCKGFMTQHGLKDKSSQLAVIKEALPINDDNPDIGINKVIANIGMLYPEPALVIIDTTNRYMAGDENKTPDATSFIQAATRLMNEFHCSVLIIHHTGLSQETQGRARGSSVFKAAMDMEFRISKTGMFITLEMTKSKDSDIQKPLVFKMVEVDAPGFFKYGGVQDTTCVLKHNEQISEAVSSEKKQGEKMSKTERFARDTYRDAAVESGKLIQDENSARSVVAVDVEDWRKVFYRQSAAEKETMRVQFNRARKILTEERRILFKQVIDGKEFYCLSKKDETYEMEIHSEVNRRQNK